MKKSPNNPQHLPKIPIYRIQMEVLSTEATLNIAGDFHYGMRGIETTDIVKDLTKQKKDVFRIFTGDLVENSLKTSVGHNYDIAIPDPDDQKQGIISCLKKIMQYQLGGEKQWEKYTAPDTHNPTDAVAVGVGGNHEYRTRKLTGQWLDREIYSAAKILPLGIEGLIELTLVNSKINMKKMYRLYVSHAPGKTSATSMESIMRAFKKKQSTLPGIDIIIFGHFHKRFLQSDGYFDSTSDTFKKVMYVINPSPLCTVEYALEAGYPPIETGYSTEIYLPIDPNKQPYGII
jgi:predicted phosphodiesterase